MANTIRECQMAFIPLIWCLAMSCPVGQRADTETRLISVNLRIKSQGSLMLERFLTTIISELRTSEQLILSKHSENSDSNPGRLLILKILVQTKNNPN